VYDADFLNLESHCKTQGDAESLLQAVQKEAGGASYRLYPDTQVVGGVKRTVTMGFPKQLLQDMWNVPLKSKQDGVLVTKSPGYNGDSVVLTVKQTDGQSLGRNTLLWVLVLLHHSMP
jgi:hypothetical protein